MLFISTSCSWLQDALILTCFVTQNGKSRYKNGYCLWKEAICIHVTALVFTCMCFFLKTIASSNGHLQHQVYGFCSCPVIPKDWLSSELSWLSTGFPPLEPRFSSQYGQHVGCKFSTEDGTYKQCKLCVLFGLLCNTMSIQTHQSRVWKAKIQMVSFIDLYKSLLLWSVIINIFDCLSLVKILLVR